MLGFVGLVQWLFVGSDALSPGIYDAYASAEREVGFYLG